MTSANPTTTPALGWRAILQSFARAWRRLCDWRSRRETAAILASLDQRTLRDIGVDRHEIGSVVYGSHRDGRRCYDADWWRRRRGRASARAS